MSFITRVSSEFLLLSFQNELKLRELCKCCVIRHITQSEHTQADDDLFTGGDAGDQSVQDAVVTNKRHHGLCKLGVTGNVHWSAAVKHRQRLTAEKKEVTEN